jgi:hypothetical protein
MILLKGFVLLAVCTSAYVVGAQEESLFGSLALGQSIDSVPNPLADRSGAIRKYRRPQTCFPLAEKTENHWILTAKQQEARLRDVLRATYGSPIFVSENRAAFENWQVFLREDTPEIVFLTESPGRYYKGEFFGQ